MGKRKNGEGSYGTKKIKGTLYQYYRDSNGKYIYGKTMKELREKIAIKKNEEKDRQNNNTKSNIFIFRDYCYKWLKSVHGDISSGTYDDYESIIKCRIENYKDFDIGGKQLKSLTVEMFNNYFKSLSKRYSKASIDKTWIVIRQVLQYGFDEEDIPEINLSRIKRPREEDVYVKKKDIPFITLDDIDRLYSEATKVNSLNKCVYGNASKVIIFIMYSGIRISEAIGLTWKYVDKDFSSIRIAHANRRIIERDDNLEAIKDENGNNVYKNIQKSPKSDDGTRTIPLPDRAVEVLKYFYDNYGHSPDSFVFQTSNGTQFNKRNIEKTLKRVLNNSDCMCKEYTPHSLRHGYGSILISNGVDIKIVSELLGHSDVSFTYNVYIGILKEDKINAVKNVFNKSNIE